MGLRTLCCASLVILWGILRGPAEAAIIAHESFDYGPIGGSVELMGGNGGVGWTGAWGNGNVAYTQVVTPGTLLSYAVSGGPIILGGARAVQITQANNDTGIRNLATSLDPVTTPEVYFRFLLRVEGTVDSDDRLGVVFWDGDSNARLGYDENGADDFNARQGVGGNGSFFGGQVTANTTYLMVGRLTSTNGGTSYNQLEGWLNPTVVQTVADVVVTGGNLNDIDGIQIRTGGLDAGQTWYLDEFKFTTKWEEVVPEPSSYLMMFVVGVLGAFQLWRLRGNHSPTVAEPT